MADWTNITDTAVDPDAPLTSQLAYAWRDNPIAIAEGASGAPKIAVPISGSGATTITFSGMSAFSGIVLEFWLAGGGSGGGSVDVSFSDDGTTYYGSTPIAVSGGSGDLAFGKIWIDFTTAALKAAGIETPTIPAAFFYSSTVSGLTTAVTHVRVTRLGGGTISAVAMPNGGIL